MPAVRAVTTAKIPVSAIERDPKQPRTVFDETALAELADSLRERGQLQPISVRRKPGKGPAKFVLVTGERRWRAAQIAGLKTLDCVVVAARKDRLVDQIVENDCRAAMTHLERATAYQRAMDELGISAGELAKRLGLRQPWRITEATSLLKLGDQARQALNSGAISPTQSYWLTALPHARQERILALLQAGKLPSEAAFKAACQAPERAAVDAPGLIDWETRKPAVKRLLASIEEAGAQLSAQLRDADAWQGAIAHGDAVLVADQLKMLVKTTAQLLASAESAVGVAAVNG